MPDGLKRHIPNALTVARLVLAIVFFAMLGFYQYEGRGDPTLLNLAFILYALALASDFFDGYLARKWQVTSTFGRIVDPFCDKILVLGSFVFFAGKNFIIPETELVTVGQREMVVKTITGVTPAMVVVLLGRELLITTLRSMIEKSGTSFGAAWSGKVKMTLQSITILVILAYVNYRGFMLPEFPRIEFWARMLRDACIWATVLITIYSGWLYLRDGLKLLRPAAGSSRDAS